VPRNVGIWIDHTKAVIVFASADRVTVKTVESEVGPHARYSGRARYPTPDGAKAGRGESVHADDQEWANKGKQILEQTGAEDIASTGETKGDFGNTDRPTRAEHVAPVAVVEH
jgi:hypothetical protein